MKVNKYIIGIIALMLSSIGLFAQDKIGGRVTDRTGQPIPGVVVIDKTTKSGTDTDANGYWSLTAKPGDIVLFSMLGYTEEQVEVQAGKTNYDITLLDDFQTLNDAVVIGYGTIQKKDLTGSIESIKGGDIVKSLSVNPTEALNGRVSGVLVTKSSNRPGADMSMLIRGKNSFNYTNEPLYVINGVPSTNGMRNINPEDIESIDILKDASSCAIYGSRGSNGVVIITTKGATRKEGFVIEYNGYAGLKTPTRMPDMLGSKGNGMDYVNFRIQQWTNKFGASSLMQPSFLTSNERRHVKYGEYYDWLREFSHDALTTNHSLSVSGSSDRSAYTLSIGYMNDGGLAGSEKFERLTANSGVEYRIVDKVNVGMSTYLSRNTINHGSNDALLSAYLITPIVGLYEPDGTETFSHRPGGRVNPFIQDRNTKNITEAWSANVAAHLAWNPLRSLTLKSQIAVQYNHSLNGYWTGTDSQYGQGVNEPYATRNEYNDQNYVWDNTITWDKEFAGGHKINAIGLFSLQKEKHISSSMTGEGLPYDSYIHAIQTANQQTGVGSNYWESSMISYMGRVNYNYKDRYLLTATARYDSTSRLAKGRRWGLLPSFAAGWSIHNEEFMKDADWLTNLKLRLSWGKTGNNNISYNVTQTVLSLDRYSFDGTGAYGFGLGSTLGNNNLMWEMTAEWNLGLDFGFLNNRITGSVDVYDRQTTGLIFERQVAKLNGYNSILQNIATTQNRGVEFTLNTVNVSTRDFLWRTATVFSLNRNKILDLDGTKTDDLGNRRFIGYPMNVIYDVRQIGIWQEEEADLAATFNAAPGWPKIEDFHKDNQIDANDYQILGTPSPDWTIGMNNTFEWKNFDLSVYAYAQIGGLYKDQFTYYFLGLNNQDWNKLNVEYWTPENRNNKYQGIGLECLWTQAYSQVVGTFLKIQNITLGYTLPQSVTDRLRFKGVRVWAAVQNPFTFSNYLGSDPQIIGESLETQLSLYPMTWTFGLNLKF